MRLTLPNRLLAPLMAVALALPLSACRSPKPLEMTDSGSRQRIFVGQQIHISLDANPTTGYAWAIEGDVPKQLEIVDVPRFTAQTAALGASGTEVWTFRGVEPGSCVLRLENRRSFEPSAAPIDEFVVTIDVR